MADAGPAGWEYRITQPELPAGATSPVMDSRAMEQWLNDMDRRGWELVTYGQTVWRSPPDVQQWWVFRRRRSVAPPEAERGS